MPVEPRAQLFALVLILTAPRGVPAATSRQHHRCTAEVVMMDTRNFSVDAPEYWAKTAVLNQLYARRHGLNFSFHVPVAPTFGGADGMGMASPTLASSTTSFSHLARGANAGWCKVRLLAQRVAAARAARANAAADDGASGEGAGCHWLFLLDSDAFVREQHVHVLKILASLLASDGATVHAAAAAAAPSAAPWPPPSRLAPATSRTAPARASAPAPAITLGAAPFDLVLAREQPLEGTLKRTQWLNTGVLLLRASAWSARLLATWEAAVAPGGRCAEWAAQWPFEQRCLEVLLQASVPAAAELPPQLSPPPPPLPLDRRRHRRRRRRRLRLRRRRAQAFSTAADLDPGGGFVPDAARKVRVVPMQLFNSPWGEFVRHIWGGHGKDLKRHTYDDALHIHGVWGTAALAEAVRDVAASRRVFLC